MTTTPTPDVTALVSELRGLRESEEAAFAAWECGACEELEPWGEAQHKYHQAVFDALPQLIAAYEAVVAERDAQKRRGDNHWETLRSIREIARASGDLDRIVQWVSDAGSGYTETAEATLAAMTDRATAAETALAERTAEVERLRSMVDVLTVDRRVSGGATDARALSATGGE